MSRKNAFLASVGSINYNTDDINSDEDKKLYQFPGFKDMYENKDFSKSSVSLEEDIEVHDIRKLKNMLVKSNINFTEVMFAQNVTKWGSFYDDLITMREEIARMNLPYLYEACVGMARRKLGDFNRDAIAYYQSQSKGNEEATQALKMKYSKNIATGIRILDSLQRYADNGFESFGNAIRYADGDEVRHLILDIRKAERSPEALEILFQMKLGEANALKDTYRAHKLDTYAEKWLNELIYHHTKAHIKDELGL